MTTTKETVQLSSVGGSIGFTIPPASIDYLKIIKNDSIQIRIFQIYQEGVAHAEVSAFMRRKVRGIGGGSLGVTIKRNIINQFSLKPGMNIGIEISKEKVI